MEVKQIMSFLSSSSVFMMLFWLLICTCNVAGFFSFPIFAPFLSSSSSSSSSLSHLFAKVALTRELGNNEKLGDLLREKNIECVEIPCISFCPGLDVDRLGDAMLQCDIIVLSSPQAANVFLDSWAQVGKPQVKIATVGKGTSKSLISSGIIPFFEPSDSTAKTLSAELPDTHGKNVLYPTSAIAENVMQSGLEERGFVVTRLNTYDTVEATWSEEELSEAKDCDIVAFASPSAVRTWANRCGARFVAVTIGPTSAKAATSLDFKEVLYPDGSKGVEAWAKLVISAVEDFHFGAC